MLIMAEDLDEIDQKRRKALAREEAFEYAVCCDELGVEPERADLYAQGKKEIKRTIDRDEFLEEIAQVHPYDLFLRDSKRRNLDVGNFESRWDEKSALLKKYFPRFRDDGKQPVRRYSPGQVGYIFKEIFIESEQVVDR